MKQLFNDEKVAGKYVVEVGQLSNGLLEVGTAEAHYVAESVLRGMAEYAKAVKSTDKPIAIVVDDLKGNMVFALKVEHVAGTETDPKGSWNPTWTFDPADIEECTVFNCSEGKSHSFFINAAFKAYGMEYMQPSNTYTSALAFANAIKSFLETNVGVDDVVEIEHPGYFTAKIQVSDGVQVLTFEASEEINHLIKDDGNL